MYFIFKYVKKKNVQNTILFENIHDFFFISFNYMSDCLFVVVVVFFDFLQHFNQYITCKVVVRHTVFCERKKLSPIYRLWTK